jgi:hypothetical protein
VACPFNEIPTPQQIALNPEQTASGQQDTFRAWRTVSQTLTNILRWLYDLQTYICSLDRQFYSDASVPAGNTISNSSAETAFASQYTIPANSLSSGQSIRLKLYAVYNIIAGSQVVEFKVKVGGQTLLGSGAVTLVGPMTNGGFALDADLFVTAIGTGGSIEAQGVAQLGAPASGSSINLTNTAPYMVNTTIGEPVTFTWQFTTANTGNNITLRAARIEVL